MEPKSRTARTPDEPSHVSDPNKLTERSSAQRKSELVLCLLRGEPLDAVSRVSQLRPIVEAARTRPV